VAVTVEGIFRIIDRASGPMARMERQAKQTDRAIARLGMTTDNVGTDKQQRSIHDTEKAIRDFGNESQRTERKLRGHNNEIARGETRLRRFKIALIELGASIRSLGAVMGLLKFPAMGVAVGVAAQAIGALAGGVIALIPKLTDLGGVMAALPIGLGAIAGAMVTVKLATADLSKAYGGNQKALARLTPEARAFLGHLKQMAPVIKELRQSAQSGLFGGLDTALLRVQRALPVANQLLREFSRTLGGLVANAAQRFTTPGFLRDILGIGQASNRALNRGGRAVTDILDAMRHLTVAAIPFTDWLTKLVAQAAKWIDHWAIFERDSGRFGQWLHRTQAALRQFGRIVENLMSFVRAIGRAARPLGDLLWRDVEKGTKAWANYANSTKGQIRLTQQLTAMYPAIHQIVTLVDNLARAIFRMGSRPELPGIVDSLDKMVPKLEALFNALVSNFGPTLADTLSQIADTLSYLVGATGPLNVFLTLLDRLLRAINWLFQKVPGLGHVFATALSVIGIGLMIRRVQALAASWFGVSGAANEAAAAEARAAGVVPTGARGVGGVAGGAVAGAAGIGAGTAAAQRARQLAQAGEAVSEGGVILPRGVQAAARATPWLARAAGRVGLGGLAARVGGAGLLGRAAGVAGRFAWPVTLALGGYGALTAQTQGGVVGAGQRVEAGINAASGGLYGGALNLGRFVGAGRIYDRAMDTPQRRNQAAIDAYMQRLGTRRGALGGEAPNYGQLGRQVALYRGAIRDFGREHGKVFRDAREQLRMQYAALRQVYKGQTDVRNQQSRAAGYRTLRQEGQAFDIYAGALGKDEAFRRTNEDVLKRMQALQGPGKRIIASNFLAWEYQETRGNKRREAIYQGMVDNVVEMYRKMHKRIAVVNGQIIEGSRTAWQQVQAAMVTPAEQARQKVTAAFTAIQAKAVEVLKLLGVSPGMATRLVQMQEQGGKNAAVSRTVQDWASKGQLGPDLLNPGGGKGRALGGRIGGPMHDRTDRFALGGNLVGAGELVVNRHTERKVNYLLAGRATLGSLVSNEGTPHSFARGGRNEPPATVTGGQLAGVQAGAAAMASALTSRFPLSITSTTGGKHAHGSYHYKGEAVDLGGSPEAMHAASDWLMSSGTYAGLQEGIHNPNLSVRGGAQVSPSFWGKNTWAGHANHIHIAVTGGGGALGAPGGGGGGGASVTLGQLLPPPSGVAGLPGVMADQAGALMAAGMMRHLNRTLAGAGAAPGMGGGGTPTANMVLAKQMMLQRGWGAGEWPALHALWMGESGFNNMARNPSSGAFGIPQALPPGKMGPAAVAGDAGAQIGWGLNYIGSRYGSPSGALSAWQGRSPHWYAEGGDFIARRPTLIGVGDREERVQITPTGRGQRGRPVQLVVHIGTIQNHREGDVVRVVHSEFEKLASQLEHGWDDGVIA
jgi:hypothetical protein